jgi:hypothetical protein
MWELVVERIWAFALEVVVAVGIWLALEWMD